LVSGLVTLYEATSDETLIDSAMELAGFLLSDFADREGGGFYYTRENQRHLIARTKDYTDASVPSGNGMAALVLLRLSKVTGRGDLADAAVNTLLAGARLMQKMPTAMGQMLLALDFHLGPTYELVLLGDRGDLAPSIRRRFLPHKVLSGRDADRDGPRSPHLEGLYAGKDVPLGETVLYACRDFACDEPAVGENAILAKLDELASERQP
jgi:uncharacterized protein YyaL (SSP411 family)